MANTMPAGHYPLDDSATAFDPDPARIDPKIDHDLYWDHAATPGCGWGCGWESIMLYYRRNLYCIHMFITYSIFTPQAWAVKFERQRLLFVFLLQRVLFRSWNSHTHK